MNAEAAEQILEDHILNLSWINSISWRGKWDNSINQASLQ